MKMQDINSNKEKIILLIHPMLSSAKGMQIFISDYLGDEYHYLIPDLSAHGEANKETYKSSADEAKQIHNYLTLKGIHHIDLAYGASLGGVILFELLKYNDLTFGKIFFEGTSFYENSHIQNLIMKKMFLSKHQQAVKDHNLAVKKMGELFGEKVAEPMANSFIAMNEESIANIVYDCAFVKLPELSQEMQEKCIFAFGEKDNDLKQARKIQPKKYPKSKMRIWKGFNHCELITKNPIKYAQILKEYL